MKQYRVIVENGAREDLRNIYDFISTKDTQMHARRFLKRLKKAILSLDFMPHRCRPSIYCDNESARDMIVQGYTIVYTVADNSVHVLAVFRQREI